MISKNFFQIDENYENVLKNKDIKFVTTKKKKLFGAKTKLYYKVFHKKFIGAKNEKFKY